MSVSFIVGKRISTAERYQLQRAATIIAVDDDPEGIVLFNSDGDGEIVVVELEEHQVLFEGPELQLLAELVERIKGSCLVSSVPIKPVEFDEEPTNRIKDSMPLDSFCDDDDDEPANWWKNGGQN